MNPFTLVLTYFVKFFVKEIHKGKVCVWESHYVRSLHTLIVQSILKNILLQRNVVLLKDISLMPQIWTWKVFTFSDFFQIMCISIGDYSLQTFSIIWTMRPPFETNFSKFILFIYIWFRVKKKVDSSMCTYLCIFIWNCKRNNNNNNNSAK